MKYIINSNYQPMDLSVVLKTNAPKNLIKTVVYDPTNNDLILSRIDNLSGPKKVILKLPITSKDVIVETFSKRYGRQPLGKDKTFSMEIVSKHSLKTYDVHLGSGDREFLEFAKKFVQQFPNLDPNGKIRSSKSGKFKFVLLPVCKSHKGKILSTPSLIGVKSGIIEISKKHFDNMSQSRRMAILCHEYGHVFKNPIMGLNAKDEFGADLNGLTVYLGSGFGLSEYINAFETVFEDFQSPQNEVRDKVLRKFAHKIYNGEYFGKPYNL